MSASQPRLVRTLLLLLLLSPLAGCIGGAHGSSLDYGVGFYRPYGYTYGGWDPGYFVGPPRRPPLVGPHPGGPRWGMGSRPGRPGMGPRPPTRALPSIPEQPRGGRPGSGPVNRPVPPR
jgi:hypothetical protein